MDEKKEVLFNDLKPEERLKSKWYILNLDGSLIPLGEFDFNGHKNLRIFSRHETEKDRTIEKIPSHVTLMRSLELVDYEPASDPGNLRYYPKGRMIKALIEDYVTSKVLDYGGMAVETPIMYDINHPTLANYLQEFPARQYILDSDNNRYILRFSSCFGHFLMAHDCTISYRNLPLRIYELTKYSFRREQKAELVGLKRLRAFTMPDIHAFCRDLQQVMKEFKRRFNLCVETLKGIGLSFDDYELVIRLTEDFYKKNKGFIKSIVKQHGKPTLVEIWKNQIFYFVFKYELNFINAHGEVAALSTDQLDVVNGERYDIRYMDVDGQEKHPFILHGSPSGAIERNIYALLEKAFLSMSEGKPPLLPLWLAPTQVRLIPTSEDYFSFAEGIAKKLTYERIRIDVDDRSKTVKKRIRAAEKEWIPYIIVLGDKEKGAEEVPVRGREDDKLSYMSLKELCAELRKRVEGKPYRPLPLPMSLRKRPKFVS